MSSAVLSPDRYINRELSWIAFNQRVLAQALDQRTPLLDQAKFSAIFSNNLDEFFMVRVASLKSQVEAGITTPSEDGKTPLEQLLTIRERLIPVWDRRVLSGSVLWCCSALLVWWLVPRVQPRLKHESDCYVSADPADPAPNFP